MLNSDDFSNKLKQQPLSRQVIYFLAKEGKPQEAQLQKAFEMANTPPDRANVQIWLLRFLGGAGIALLLSGVMFFFAYNWADMSKFAKISLVSSCLIAAGIFTLLQPAGTFMFQIGLTALTVLTGIQLALLGQIYQGGANAYDFFLAWSCLTVFWVASSNFPPLWFFYIVLLNTTIILYAIQVRLINSEGALMLLLTIVNGIIAALWEWHRLNKEDNTFKARWFPRIMMLATCICVGVPAIVNLFDSSPIRNISMLIFVVLNLGIFWFYQQKLKDIFMLALPIIGGLIFINSLISKLIFDVFRYDNYAGLFLPWSILNLSLTVLALRHLIKINKEWKMQEINH